MDLNICDKNKNYCKHGCLESVWMVHIGCSIHVNLLIRNQRIQIFFLIPFLLIQVVIFYSSLILLNISFQIAKIVIEVRIKNPKIVAGPGIIQKVSCTYFINRIIIFLPYNYISAKGYE